MEAFSLLKYWRGGGGLGIIGGGGGGDGSGMTRPGTGTTTIVTKVGSNQEVEEADEDDEGPFFDLEFAVPDEDEITADAEEEEKKEGEEESRSGSGSDSEEEKEFDFTLSSSSSTERVGFGSDSDPNMALSPSDDLFFKGSVVNIEPNSAVDSKLPNFPVNLLKSATKFRVLLLRLKKSKIEAGNAATTAEIAKKKDGIEEESGNGSKNKFFTVKFKVEEVPIVSLFTRDGSKSQKQSIAEESVSEEKKFSKDVMQKYLKKVKPLYVRVSKRYGEKLRFSGQLNSGSAPPSTVEKGEMEAEVGENQGNVKKQKEGNIPAGLRVVCKHLGKSRSASSAVAAAPSPVLSQRRDDSLLQQQDGIQSAILHCKRSFNGSQDSESSLLPRSISNPSHEKSINSSRNQEKSERKKH